MGIESQNQRRNAIAQLIRELPGQFQGSLRALHQRVYLRDRAPEENEDLLFDEIRKALNTCTTSGLLDRRHFLRINYLIMSAGLMAYIFPRSAEAYSFNLGAFWKKRPAPAKTRVNFDYTGSDQSWVVPAGVTSITVAMVGAGGGRGASNAEAGGGGASRATISTTPGETLTIIVGQGGGAPGASGSTAGTYGGGGGWYGGYAGGGTSGAGGTGGEGGGGTSSSGGAAGSDCDATGTAGSAFQGGHGGIRSGDGYQGGGGGGGGYYGGGGGGFCSAILRAGGGGSGYVPAGGTTTAGSGKTPGTVSGFDFTGYGKGGDSSSNTGQNGRVIIEY